MIKYRIARRYEILKIIDPYTIAILILLRKGSMNLSEIFRNVSEIAIISMMTLVKKIRGLLEYNLIAIVERRKGPLAEEKRYQLTPRGRQLADAFLKILGNNAYLA